MKINLPSTLSQLSDFDQFSRWASITFSSIIKVINGGLDFSNLNCQIVSVTFAFSSTDTAVPHSLQQVPIGYIVINRSGNFNIWNGVTPFNTTQIFLRASATGTATVILLGG